MFYSTFKMEAKNLKQASKEKLNAILNKGIDF